MRHGRRTLMKRKGSSRLGDLQADGNLGNERHRGPKSDRMRNRWSEESMRERDRSRETADTSEEWAPGDDTYDDEDVGGNS
jgi:hypothetical protein